MMIHDSQSPWGLNPNTRTQNGENLERMVDLQV